MLTVLTIVADTTFKEHHKGLSLKLLYLGVHVDKQNDCVFPYNHISLKNIDAKGPLMKGVWP